MSRRCCTVAGSALTERDIVDIHLLHRNTVLLADRDELSALVRVFEANDYIVVANDMRTPHQKGAIIGVYIGHCSSPLKVAALAC